MGTHFRKWACLGLILGALLSDAAAREFNLWPFYVEQEDSPYSREDHIGSMGPLFSFTEKTDADIVSIRPFWTSFQYREKALRSDHILYPFLNWYDRGEVRYGHALNLIQYRRNDTIDTTFFQAFPFIFSNRTPNPEDSYFALWPLGGVLKNRFWRDRITFAAWPLFVQTVREDETRTHVPYPFIQLLDGPQSKGFGLWPLFGHFERENDYAHTWALWPIHYHYRDKLDEAVPYVRFGLLPFYHRETAAGLKSESFIWPFFGYTRESEPRVPYSENRYFWPFLVQGRGEENHVNRWLPLFAHEREPGYAKEWYGWPFLKRETFTQPGLVRERTSILYFLYRDEQQFFKGKEARLMTLWPLAGYWNDGHGRKQLQMLDPLTVFFPRNEKIKENWSPLFALYRFDERAGHGRHSLLWDLFVWERDDGRFTSFYAGPLFEWVHGSHWEILKGLVGSSKEEGEGGLRLFWKR